MDFEQAFIKELNEISEIKNKVFPLYAPKDTTIPFVVYKKDRIEYKYTINGTRKSIEGIYDIVIVSRTYAEAQNITEKIISKIHSMLNRQIGDEGPFIQDIRVIHNGDNYEYESDLFRTNLTMNVYY